MERRHPHAMHPNEIHTQRAISKKTLAQMEEEKEPEDEPEDTIDATQCSYGTLGRSKIEGRSRDTTDWWGGRTFLQFCYDLEYRYLSKWHCSVIQFPQNIVVAFQKK